MSYLVKTTFDEIAALVDEADFNENIAISTEDPDELAYYNLQTCKYNLICKSKLMYEKDYSVIIGLIDGHCTVAKDIHILANGNINDEDSRIEGIREFVEEYYEKYMPKNEQGYIYLIENP